MHEGLHVAVRERSGVRRRLPPLGTHTSNTDGVILGVRDAPGGVILGVRDAPPGGSPCPMVRSFTAHHPIYHNITLTGSSHYCNVAIPAKRAKTVSAPPVYR